MLSIYIYLQGKLLMLEGFDMEFVTSVFYLVLSRLIFSTLQLCELQVWKILLQCFINHISA